MRSLILDEISVKIIQKADYSDDLLKLFSIEKNELLKVSILLWLNNLQKIPQANLIKILSISQFNDVYLSLFCNENLQVFESMSNKQLLFDFLINSDELTLACDLLYEQEDIYLNNKKQLNMMLLNKDNITNKSLVIKPPITRKTKNLAYEIDFILPVSSSA